MIVRKWEHAGMTCAIRHGVLGCPCGYVRLPEGHPLHEAGIDEAEESGIEAYGGVTFAGELREPEAEGWWIGFDMAHACDVEYVPETLTERPLRTDEDCIRETEILAEQLAERGK